MPAEIIDRPNPQPLPSHLPDVIDRLRPKLDSITLSEEARNGLIAFRRAADYIAAAMIFLQDNVYLKREIKPEDIKPRLLGAS
jgi:xylulose-5-phosphate/fructose-6-phosphate phosphoketolase